MMSAAVCVPFYVLVSESPLYRSHIVELAWSRAVHSCAKCCLTGVNSCPSELHRGRCTAATVLPLCSRSPAQLPSSPVAASNDPAALCSRSVHHYRFPPHLVARAPCSTPAAVHAAILPRPQIIQEKSVTGDSSQLSASKDELTGHSQSHRQSSQAAATALAATSNKTHRPTSVVSSGCGSCVSRIPAFYFPRGKPRSPEEVSAALRSLGDKLRSLEARSGPPGSTPVTIHKSKMDEVTKILKIPLYWKQLVFVNCGGSETSPHITRDSIVNVWQKLLSTNHSDVSKFFALVTQDKKQFIEPQDFYPLVQDVLETHPGLTFLLSARDFHSRYIATVVYRIFFGVNCSWTGRISMQELARSDLLPVILSLETTDDINTVTQYFSYEHFYVIYCKFWELDEDHDLVISKSDLARHNNYAISERMIERIFSGAVTKSRARSEGLMTYTEFVWFLLAEEDKRHPRSIEYWFRCMDLDGDGVLSLYELEYFYQEQLFRMEEMGIEPISFEDCVCQMLDMVRPSCSSRIRLADLKACRLVHIFFDTFFNLTKYLEHEQRDPFTNLKDLEDGLTELSDWDRYAAEAYEVLVAEDGSQDNYNDNYRESAAGVSYRNSNESNSADEEASSPATTPVAASSASVAGSGSGVGAGTGAVYENVGDVGSSQSSQSKTTKGVSVTDGGPRYSEFVNGKLADLTSPASPVTAPAATSSISSTGNSPPSMTADQPSP